MSPEAAVAEFRDDGKTTLAIVMPAALYSFDSIPSLLSVGVDSHAPLLAPRTVLPWVEELTPRITPSLSPSFAAGTLTVAGDGADDSAILTAIGTGDISLNGAAITKGATLWNTFAILIRKGPWQRPLDVSALPGAGRTAIIDRQDGDDTVIGVAGADSLAGNGGDSATAGLAPTRSTTATGQRLDSI
jgi:hypothetical protein